MTVDKNGLLLGVGADRGKHDGRQRKLGAVEVLLTRVTRLDIVCTQSLQLALQELGHAEDILAMVGIAAHAGKGRESATHSTEGHEEESGE